MRWRTCLVLVLLSSMMVGAPRTQGQAQDEKTDHSTVFAGEVIYEADWSTGFGGWRAGDSSWQTSDGVLSFDGSGHSYMLAPANAAGGLRNYAIEAVVMFGECAWADMSLVSRLDDDDNAARGGIYNVQDERWNAGANYGTRAYAEDYRVSSSLTGWRTLRLEVMGDEYYFVVNGARIDYGSDDRLLDGGSGEVGFLGGPECEFQVNSFRIIATGFGDELPASDFGGDESVVFSLVPGADTSTWRLRHADSLGTSVRIVNGFVSPPYSPGFLSSYAIEADIRVAELTEMCDQEGGLQLGIQLYPDAGSTWAAYVRDELCDGSTEAVLMMGEVDWSEPAGRRGLSLDNAWHRFRLEVENTSIRFFYDGTLVGESSDDRLPSVITPYFRSWGAEAEFRNIRVISPVSAFSPSGASDEDRGANGGGTIENVPGAESGGTGAIADMIPAAAEFDVAFSLVAEGMGSRNDHAALFSDPNEGLGNLATWGWKESGYAIYENPNAFVNKPSRVEITIHRFGDAAGAAAALPGFTEAHAESPGRSIIAIPEIGDQSQGVSGALDDHNEVTIFVQNGLTLIQITVTSRAGDPEPLALTVAQLMAERTSNEAVKPER